MIDMPYLFNGDCINLVVEIQTRFILTIPYDDIHKLIHSNFYDEKKEGKKEKSPIRQQDRYESILCRHTTHRSQEYSPSLAKTSADIILYSFKILVTSFWGSGPNCGCGTVEANLTPPPVFFLVTVTSGGRWLSRMPTVSNSRSRISR